MEQPLPPHHTPARERQEDAAMGQGAALLNQVWIIEKAAKKL